MSRVNLNKVRGRLEMCLAAKREAVTTLMGAVDNSKM